MRRADTLHCSDFEKRIHEILDDRLILSADPSLNEHAKKCPECAVLMQNYEKIELALTSNNSCHELPTRSPIATTKSLTLNLNVILTLVATLVISLNIYSSYVAKINAPTAVVAKITPPPAVGLFSSDAVPARITRRETKRPTTPLIASPSNSEFLIAHSVQGIEVLRIPSWSSISHQFELLKPWIDRSKPLFEYSPALFPVCHFSSQWKKTIQIIQQSFLESNNQPGIGKWEQSTSFRAA
jgi:hypothetical protein